LGILGAIIWLISFTADLKGLGIPIPDIVEKENIPSDIGGVLLPDNAPTPPHNCLPHIPKDAIKFFFGQVLLYQSKFPITVVRMAGEDLLSLKKVNKGFLISAKIFSDDGRIVTQIEDNKIYINRNNYFRPERPNKHTFSVHDQRARKVLDIYFINPNTIRILGIFNAPNRRPLIIEENRVVAELNAFSGICMGEGKTSIIGVR
jgi:hypothetical protein